MTVYRFCSKAHARDLSGEGARQKGGRWNPVGVPVTYASEYISLGLLEVLANAGTIEQLRTLQLMEISIPEHASIHEIQTGNLKKNWRHDIGYTQFLGGEILKTAKSLLIKCPSVLVEQEHNYLLNTFHPGYASLRIARSAHFHFDERLYRND